MPLLIVRNDITNMHVDAIVNAAKPSLLGGGGVDGAIHTAAGPELREACRALGGCPVGGVRLTPGYRLPCRWVIHTVGPVWQGGTAGERELLLSCYRNALELAESLNCESIAFPLISSGAYGYPKELAARAAREAIRGFLRAHEMQVFLVVFGEESLEASRGIVSEIREYIDSAYVRQRRDRRSRRETGDSLWTDGDSCFPREAEDYEVFSASSEAPSPPAPARKLYQRNKRRNAPGPASAAREASGRRPAPAPAETPNCFFAEEAAPVSPFDRRFGCLDESFQQMLFRKIDELGMNDADCYKRANVDRKLFSKIRKDEHYKPSKPTALAFAVALELDLEETEELLEKAGFALSRSSRFDLIVRWFIERSIYDVDIINEALFEFDQVLLGNAS